MTIMVHTNGARRLAMAAVVSLLVIVSPPAWSQAPSSTRPVILQLSATFGKAALYTRQDQFFADEVARRTNGRYRIEVYPTGSLVPIQQVFAALKSGTVELAEVHAAFVSGEIPAVSILEVPYFYPIEDSDKHIAFAREVGPILDEIMAKNNVKYLGSLLWIHPLWMLCRDGFKLSESDYKGKKIRGAGRWITAAVRNWGAQGVAIPTGETYTAMERGMVDCALNVPDGLTSLKLTEVGKFATRIDANGTWGWLGMSMQAWKKLSAEDQAHFLAAARAMEDHSKVRIEDLAAEVKKLEDSGVKLATISPAERERLRKGSDAVWDQIRKIQGPDGERLMRIVEKYRQ
jgi:TRAP-type transport system periplasmic protein